MDTKSVAEFFEINPSINGYQFQGKLISSETDVLQLNVSFRDDELPVYLTVTDQQILCIVYLWKDAEIKPESRNELMESMLELNIPMPLSSFCPVPMVIPSCSAHYIRSHNSKALCMRSPPCTTMRWNQSRHFLNIWFKENNTNEYPPKTDDPVPR